MKKYLSVTLPLFFSFLLLLSHSVFSQDTLTIVTYYPSPYGVYKTLRVINDDDEVLLGSDDHNPNIELRDKDADGHTPYIDFSNDSGSDYDMRIILQDDDTLEVVGGRLKAKISSEGGSITICP